MLPQELVDIIHDDIDVGSQTIPSVIERFTKGPIRSLLEIENEYDYILGHMIGLWTRTFSAYYTFVLHQTPTAADMMEQTEILFKRLPEIKKVIRNNLWKFLIHFKEIEASFQYNWEAIEGGQVGFQLFTKLNN